MSETFDPRIDAGHASKQQLKRPPILTIGMPVYNDYAGVAFTITSLLLHHPEVLPDVEFLVVDNNPDCPEGRDVAHMLKHNVPNSHYVAFKPYSGTLVKNQVVAAAQTEYVLCCDSHVMFKPGSIAKLIKFLKATGSCNDLFQGPLIDAKGSIHATHMLPAFRSTNFGIWGTYRTPEMDNPDMYELPLQGCGIFCCRRDSWLGFHPAMHQFGSEEGYIHEKYRISGRKAYSLPFLQWWHLFRNESRNIHYTMRTEHKYRNMLIAWTEIDLPLNLVEDFFAPHLLESIRAPIRQSVAELGIQVMPRPQDVPAFLGYPIRHLTQGNNTGEDYREFERPKFVER